jgi:TPR repeat protein
MSMKRVLVGLVVTAALMGSAVAGPLEDGTAAIRHGDYTMALRLAEPLADKGDAEAQYNLGFMYAVGQGVRQDFVRAYMWLDLAAAQGYPDAISYRDRVAANMTSDQLAEARRLAREWKPKTSP